MSSRATLSVLRVAGLVAAVFSAACGDDDKSQGGEPVGQLPSGDAAVGMDGARASSLMDAGRSALDATLTPPSHDGSLGADAAPADATLPAELADAGGPAVPLVPLPHDGAPLAVCYADADCKGDDLVCVGSLGVRGAGFCSDDCTEDKHCPAVAGVPASCSFEGACVLGCAGSDGKGGGSCPPNMVCRDVTEGNLLTQAKYQCTYPLGAGSKSVAANAKCELSHGDGDCAGLLVCHVPAGGLVSSPDDGTGYCAPACRQSADCQAPAGSTAAPLCERGACELDCDAIGASCPAGFSCRDVDDVPVLTQKRCRLD
jgi:hypothetical protein